MISSKKDKIYYNVYHQRNGILTRVAEGLAVDASVPNKKLISTVKEELKKQFHMKMRWPVIHRLVWNEKSGKYEEAQSSLL